MKITLRPYTHDTARWHIDIRLMNPCDSKRTIRRRLVAPAGLSEAQARSWGGRQVPTILRDVLGPKAADEAGKTLERTTKTSSNQATQIQAGLTPPIGAKTTPEVTLAVFFEERFMPEHVALQKPATQETYEQNFRVHIRPHLGALPLAAIDEDRLSVFRAALRRNLAVRTVNFILSQVAKILRFARKVKALTVVPEVEKLPTPRSRPKEVYSNDEIELLLRTAKGIDPTWELICLLALDAGLRASEICALEWRDVDLEAGSLTIQHNVFRGNKQTPKGTIGKVTMTSALSRAIARQRRREPIGPLVLYRRNYKTGHEWRAHTRHSLTRLLHRIQRECGLRKSGPHLLRHTALTRLSNLGASVYVIQAVARHSDLQTTQAYLHTQQATRTTEAAHLLDQAASTRSRGKKVAKRAKSRRTK